MRSSFPSAALVAALATLGLAAAPAAAAPAVTGEFDPHGRPGPLTLGPDGNVWAVVADGDADVVKIAPDGAVTPYRDLRLANATGITTGPDGNLWVVRNGEVVRFAPADPEGTDTAVTIATLNDPKRIVSDGRVLWTASGDQLYRIDPASNSVTRTRIDGMSARTTALGGDGRILIADFDGARIVSLDPAAPDRPAFVDVGGRPQEVSGGNGATFAYTNALTDPHEVGVVTPPGAPLRTPVPGTDPSGLALGDDGAWWIANFNSHDLTRLAADGTVTKLGGLSPLSGPRNVVRGTGGTLWVSLEVARRVARVSGVEAPRVDPPRTDPPRTDPPRRADTPRDVTAPKLALARVGRPRAGARALTVRVSVSEAASISATLRQRVAGKRRGGSCVKPSRRLRRARSCTRWVALGSASARTGGAGDVRLVLKRRGGGRLPAGRYRIEIGARDAAGNRAAKTLAITLRKPR